MGLIDRMSGMTTTKSGRNTGLMFIGVLLVMVVALLSWNFFVPQKEASSAQVAGGTEVEATASPSRVVPESMVTVSPLTSGVSTSGVVSVDASGRAVCADVPVPADKMFSAEAPAFSDLMWDTTPNSVYTFPLSRSQGPMYRPGFTGQCYAHTPVGATLAAMNFVAALQDSRVSRADVAMLMAKGAPTDEIFEPYSAEAAKYKVRFMGYTVDSYSVSEAKLRVYLYIVHNNTGAEQKAVLDMTMVWESGDWKVKKPGDKIENTQDKMQHRMRWVDN